MTESLKRFRKDKGDDYEKYVAEKLKKDYDNVWLWKFTPPELLKKHNIKMEHDDTIKDIGIDVVAIKDDKLYFFQCKNHENCVHIGCLSGFLWFMLIHNVDGTICYPSTISKNITKPIKDHQKNNESKNKVT